MKKKITIIMTLLILSIAIAVPAIVSADTTTVADRPDSLLAYCQQLIEQLVADKKLDQADADAVIADLTAKEAEWQADRPARGMNPNAFAGMAASDLAALLGITEEDLTTQLTEGKTLWQIADAAGKLDELKAAIIKQADDRLAEQVTAGDLTAEEAKTRLDEFTAKVEAITADSDDHALGYFGRGSGRGGRVDGNGNGLVDDSGDGHRGHRGGDSPDAVAGATVPGDSTTNPTT